MVKVLESLGNGSSLCLQRARERAMLDAIADESLDQGNHVPGAEDRGRSHGRWVLPRQNVGDRFP